MRRIALAIALVSALSTWSAGTVAAEQYPYFDNLNPEPFSTSLGSLTILSAHAESDSRITEFSLWLNGQKQAPALETGPSGDVTGSYRIDLLTDRVYTLTTSAKDAEGDEFRAQWDFLVAENPGNSVFFLANGQPRTAQINATMRSLVEAFRWHLYGLSWDGANHPDLPSHVGLTGQGTPLETWVSGTSFNQTATTATLRSLVEAFRWHFWGISWDNAAHCSIPTHIPNCTQFQPPQGLDPWFTAGGQPIRANIEATLRSLVESFRWHFWGYSWDGEHHFEIPTHGY